MCKSLLKYGEEATTQLGNVVIGDMDKQVQLILFMVGMCRGEFNLGESIGQYLGNFEHKKIKDLLNFSMSSFSKISEQFGDKKKLFSLAKQGAKMGMQIGVQMAQDKGKQLIKVCFNFM